MKLYHIFLSIFFLFSVNLIGQEEIINELKEKLGNCSSDTCRINTLLDLALQYEQTSTATMLSYHQQAIVVLEDNPDYIKGQRKSLLILGTYHFTSGELDVALEDYSEILAIDELQKDTVNYVTTLAHQARILLSLGNLEEAARLNTRALTLCETINDLEGEADNLNNLAIIFFRKQNLEKAKDYFLRILEIRKTQDSPGGLASAYNNLGLVYLYMSMPDKALDNYKKAIKLLKTAGDEFQLAQGYINLANLLTSEHQFEEAFIYHSKALHLMEKQQNQLGITQSKLSLGEYYQETKEYDKGIKICKEGLEIANKSGLLLDEETGYNILTELYTEKGDYKAAFMTYQQQVVLQDSISSMANETIIAELETKYKVEKKERENLALEKDNFVNERKIRNFKVLIFSILFLFIILGAAAMVYYRQRELKLKLKGIVLEQKALKAQMNPHFIFNALNSIQSCILTGEKEIAYTYHSKFAILMRLILSNSQEESIQLKDELKSLKLYIELEQFRTENAFNFNINIDEDIDLKKQLTPALLFQPFVENAIWHGMMNNKSETGQLNITLKKDGENINCIIKDNGIGRKAAKNMKSKLRDPNHKSVGIDVTTTRIEIFNRKYGSNVEVIFNDLFNNNIASGTLVQFNLPYISS